MSELGRYAEAAEKYRPEKVKLLWIAEAPPLVLPPKPRRYFYFEEMSQHDWLFRGVIEAMFADTSAPSAGRSKALQLREFQAAGAFPVDVCKDPAQSWMYHEWWPTTEKEVQELDPEHIIVVKYDVCRFVYPKLKAVGLDERLLTRGLVPFPAPGRQREFHDIVDPLVYSLSRVDDSRPRATCQGGWKGREGPTVPSYRWWASFRCRLTGQL